MLQSDDHSTRINIVYISNVILNVKTAYRRRVECPLCVSPPQEDDRCESPAVKNKILSNKVNLQKHLWKPKNAHTTSGLSNLTYVHFAVLEKWVFTSKEATVVRNSWHRVFSSRFSSVQQFVSHQWPLHPGWSADFGSPFKAEQGHISVVE